MGSLFGRTDILTTLLSIPAFLFVFAIKGYSQALTAEKLGDSTPRLQGRLTMNPFAHIDIWGFLFIVLFKFGWGKPVIINKRYFKNVKRDSAIYYASGIIGCIIGGIIMFFIYLILSIVAAKYFNTSYNEYFTYFLSIFYYASNVCLLLANFYLLPLPGLDGYNLITNFLPAKYNYKLYNIEKYSMFIFIGFILLLNIEPIRAFLFWPSDSLMNFLQIIGNSIFVKLI